MRTKQKPQEQEVYKETVKRIVTLGEIEDESVNCILVTIKEANKEDEGIPYEKREWITIILNSGGGDVYSAIALCDEISISKTPIKVVVQGKAMSSALIIVASAHYAEAGKRASFMYHEMHWSIDASGGVHKNEVKEFERLQSIYDSTLSENCPGMTKEVLQSHRDTQIDWYFDSKKAIELGLINSIS